MLFKPTIVLNSVLDINKELLDNNGIKGLILDLDNTLTTHNNPKPADGVLEWIDNMKKSGISLIIVSNNRFDRVRPFAEALGIDFVSDGAKPLTIGFKKARLKMKLSFSEVAIVGDQFFTDILGANLKRIKTIYVFPFELEKGIFFKIKRTLEKPFIPKRRKI